MRMSRYHAKMVTVRRAKGYIFLFGRRWQGSAECRWLMRVTPLRRC